MKISIKRIYEEPAPADGVRVLVDRLWPRGVSKERAQLARWLKEIAPSTELRRWVHAHLDDWDEFHRRYLAELEAQPEVLAELRELAREGEVLTLLYSVKDPERNHARILQQVLAADPGSERA